MARHDRFLRFTGGLLRVLAVLNIACAFAFAASLAATWPLAGAILRRIAAAYGEGADAGAVLTGLRGLFVLGMVAAAPVHAIVPRLADIVVTVRARSPFDPANAGRVRAIGWALLALQLLDVPLVLVVGRLEAAGAEAGGYTPSVLGWLSVLIAFVLARVFAEGARMHEELEGTV